MHSFCSGCPFEFDLLYNTETKFIGTNCRWEIYLRWPLFATCERCLPICMVINNKIWSEQDGNSGNTLILFYSQQPLCPLQVHFLIWKIKVLAFVFKTFYSSRNSNFILIKGKAVKQAIWLTKISRAERG